MLEIFVQAATPHYFAAAFFDQSQDVGGKHYCSEND